jgi:hypothetical protein
MKEKTKKIGFFILATLPFALLGMEIIVLLIESLFYGTMDFWALPFQAIIIHWICTIIVWCSGLFLLNLFSKKIGYNIFENINKPTLINWIIVGIIIILAAIVSYVSWEMHFKPIVEFNGLKNRYGNIGIVAFIFQYLYYIVESMLFLAIIVFGQEFGERAFKTKIIPWGGIMCALTWGLAHILTQNLSTGIYSFFVSILYGLVYLQMKKNIKYAYIIIAIMFMI